MNTKLSAIITILLVSMLIGCSIPSIGRYADNKIGRPIERQIERALDPGSYSSRIGWKEKTYKLDNGNWVYVERDSKNCFIHWEVNPQGIIVGYKLEGSCY